ncbi:hypothetical protein Bhyg_02219 [Pseudolycoriella hygida]|uniref:MD-2-related lipid-recognition domain-containing protein n=1 Tax=Pseudolycoriella hygida TaxID=35572 RepID=A0A9Q0NC93_9DIPT|nr:hypothetical protein Bhyg_02219 [Pseudolycoriella hygida]
MHFLYRTIIYFYGICLIRFGTFDFIQDEGCGVLLLGTCPIKSGNLYLANFTYNVSHFTYLGYAVMQINVNDDSHNTIICAQFFGIIAQK